MRVDVMAKMRGVGPFGQLWDRRTTFLEEDGTSYDILSLPDLVAAKKTQRDKDWPMIRRLMEADYAGGAGDPSVARVRLWLAEGRTPGMLVELARRYPEERAAMAEMRPLLREPLTVERIEILLNEEEQAERAADREYWAPLRQELEQMRRGV